MSASEWPGPDDATRARVADIISTNSLIASLLYDINLLPEQISDARRYGYMLAVIDHMLVFASRVSARVPQVDRGDAVNLVRDLRDYGDNALGKITLNGLWCLFGAIERMDAALRRTDSTASDKERK